MRVLAITKIFPNRFEPLSSPFNRQQFRALKELCDLTVLAAIPYVPLAERVGKPPRAAKLATLPDRDVLDGIDTRYLRQLYVPKVGLSVALPLYLASLVPYRALAREHDVVLGTWAYPDGCAAVAFAHALGKPAVVKVHGSDMNVVAKVQSARAVMRKVLPRADAMVAVSRALGAQLQELGVPRERVHLVANGVDTEVFRPRDRGAARRELGLPEDRPLIVFVGRLEPQKGLGELLEAFAALRRVRPDAMLALVGEGVMRPRVDELRRAWGDALLAPGARPLREVATWVAASNVFTLPSWSEGTPNVVLEALASGRPAVASRVGGIPDVLANPESGILVEARDAGDLARGLGEALVRTWDEAAIVAAGPRSWSASAAALHDVLAAVVRRPA